MSESSLTLKKSLEKAILRNQEVADLSVIRKEHAEHPGVWKWTGQQQDLICKVATNANEKATRKVLKELQVLREYDSLAIAPPLQHDLGSQGLLSGFTIRYIPYEEIKEELTDMQIESLALKLSRFHAHSFRQEYPFFGMSLPVLFGGHTYWIGGRAILMDLISQMPDSFPDNLKKQFLALLAAIDEMESSLRETFRPQEMVLIHGDLSRENVLFPKTNTEEPFVIDFGESVIGPGHYDLARLAVSFQLDEEREEKLINQYRRSFADLTKFQQEDQIFDRQYQVLKMFSELDLNVVGGLLELRHNSNREYTDHIVAHISKTLDYLEENLSGGI